jgi:hypothetical protein
VARKAGLTDEANDLDEAGTLSEVVTTRIDCIVDVVVSGVKLGVGTDGVGTNKTLSSLSSGLDQSRTAYSVILSIWYLVLT